MEIFEKEKEMIKEQVKPKDIDISNGLCGSELGKSEKETIACNIIVISRKNDNDWLEFTFDEYKARCRHKATESERDVLNELVKESLLVCDNDKYAVQDAFIAKLWKFVTKK